MKPFFPLLLIVMLTCSCTQNTAKILASDCGFLDNFSNRDSLQCGQLPVPENHDEPGGKQIHITYLVIKALSSSPKPDPFIYFSGGPGGSTLTQGQIQYWMRHPVRKTRDIIIFDQRGIGYSTQIPNMEEDLFRIMAQDIDEQDEQAQMDDLLTHYRALCEEKGIDLAHYNTFQNARDVGALMTHLGHDYYNLYGVSYGTRLARVVQDLFPERLNAVIHNSPSHLGGDFLVGRLESYSLALERIFQYCDQDEDCKVAYPKLQGQYVSSIEKLRTQPIHTTIKGQSFVVNAQDAIYLLRRKLYGNNSRKEIPRLIQELDDGGGDMLDSVIEGEFLFTGSYNSTMWMAVERYEMFDPKYRSDVELESVYEGLPLFPNKLGIFHSIYRAALKLHDAYLPEKEKTFQDSSVPTIITVNHYDPVTPPENGYIFKSKIPSAHLYILDEGGHGGGNPACRNQVMIDFMNDPDIEPDISCLNIYGQK